MNRSFTTALIQDLERIIASREDHSESSVTGLYWQIGNQLVLAALSPRRAEYGALIVAEAGRQLESRHGPGFARKSLLQMIRFARAFPDERRVAALREQLSWSHLRHLINIPDSLKRDYYTEMCRIEGWSTRLLAGRLANMLYERTLLAKMPEHLIRQSLLMLREKDAVTPSMVFQDPYVFDFLNLQGTFSERDLESAIPHQLGRFLLELGGGFAFVERQKHITLEGHDYYIDLLLYHCRMRRYIAVELKVGDFKPADSAQIELYLRWLNRYRQQMSDATPLGIILCAGKHRAMVEYLNLNARGIHVAEYSTQPIARKRLEERLRHEIQAARGELTGGSAEEAGIDGQ